MKNYRNKFFILIATILLGFLIVTNIGINETTGFLNLNSIEYNVKHMERNNNGYIGYHVYFKLKKNIYFPIELQIWDSKNEQNNINSHILYKQDYIVWKDKYNNL